MYFRLLCIILEFHSSAGSAAGWGRQDDAGVVKVYKSNHLQDLHHAYSI